MKALKFKTQLLAGLSLVIALSTTNVWAGQRTNDDNSPNEVLPPDSLGNIIDALSNQRLTATDAGKFSTPTLNLSQLGAASLSGSVSKDGIPGRHGEGPGMPVDDVTAQAYNSVQMIELVLEERKNYPMGPRVLYMENGIRTVLKLSADKANEEALRETLNRGLDIISLVLPITAAGSPEASAQWASNFYRSVMILAAGLQNNDRQKILRVSPTEKEGNNLVENPEQVVAGLTSAKFGQVYANLLWRFSTVPGTRASKAVILMRLLGYLGHDLNEDLARRNEGVARTIADIYRLESDPIYQTILVALRKGQSPSSSELATLRSRTYTILTKLPERLGKAPSFGELGTP